MTDYLKQSTAATLILGPFVDSGDGATLETGLTISQADVRLSKNGAAFAQKNDANAATHMENAQYSCALNTTDTNTLGRLRVTVYESGALIWWKDYSVVTANWWDTMFSTDKLQVHVDEMTANIITAAALASDAVTEIQNGLATAAALQIVDDFVDELESRLTATRAGYLDNLSAGAVALASAVATLAGYVDTEVAAIKAKTDNLPADPADDSDIDAQLAAIAAYIDTEIAAIKAKTDNLPASPAAVGSAMTLAADAVNSTSLAASAVTEIQSGLSTLSAGDVKAEVVDALATDTYAEPGSVPAATASLAAKIGFLVAALRNKHVTTATTDTIRNDADSGDIGTATLADSGTAFTRGEYS